MNKKININLLEELNTVINIFNYSYYNDLMLNSKNYIQCEGYDIISKCIENDKCWEPYQTEITNEILKKYNGIFVDIGCHIGYYSILASLLGKEVISVDGNKKYLNLFRKTIEDNDLKKIRIINKFIDNSFLFENLEINLEQNISLLKVDIEGFEKFTIQLFDNLIKKKKIKNIILEISPKLDSEYDILCIKLFNSGYKNIFDLGLSRQRKLNFNTNHLNNMDDKRVDINNIKNYIENLEFSQSNFLFSL